MESRSKGTAPIVKCLETRRLTYLPRTQTKAPLFPTVSLTLAETNQPNQFIFAERKDLFQEGDLSEFKIEGSGHQRNFSFEHSIPRLFSRRIVPGMILRDAPDVGKIPFILSARAELETH